MITQTELHIVRVFAWIIMSFRFHCTGTRAKQRPS